ncbi:hypothetical protein BR93DRAFT_262127 [Coniochaeta sp. PMI_546]|nr:hypothetical protein BR93DRAFT_262127 [Coniochaeta sp. PMI_546]
MPRPVVILMPGSTRRMQDLRPRCANLNSECVSGAIRLGEYALALATPLAVTFPGRGTLLRSFDGTTEVPLVRRSTLTPNKSIYRTTGRVITRQHLECLADLHRIPIARETKPEKCGSPCQMSHGAIMWDTTRCCSRALPLPTRSNLIRIETATAQVRSLSKVPRLARGRTRHQGAAPYRAGDL